jgi:hypothetical protein
MWTKAEDRLLLRLWPDHSASEIGVRVHKSRNAVIGRYHRLQHTEFPHVVRNRKERREARRLALEAEERMQLHHAVALQDSIGRGIHRRAAILQALIAGAMIRTVGHALGVTRQRVHQLIHAADGQRGESC